MNLRFLWDEAKARGNRRAHGVAFEEAVTVFADPQHSVGERREIIVGHSSQHRLLLVCFTERVRTVRLISARRATRHERREYENFRKPT